jgi:hypothetical protein
MAATLASVLVHLRRVQPRAVTGTFSDADLLSRYVRHRDEAAFAALVGRHGPMVLHVCRRMLNDTHAAERRHP